MNHDEGLDEPEIQSALRDAMGSTELDGVDWDALQRRVMEAVEREEARPWWAVTAHWASVVVPVSMAASLASVVTLMSSPSAQSTDSEYSILDGALGGPEARLEFMETVLPVTAEDLIAEETLN